MVTSPNEWKFLKAPNKQKTFVQRLWTFTNIFIFWPKYMRFGKCSSWLITATISSVSHACWGPGSQWESLVGTWFTVREPCGDPGHSERTSRGPGSELSSSRGPGFLYMATQSFRRDSRNPGPTSQQVKQEKDTSPLTCP